MGRPFWLGIIGGIFGILAGIGVALIAGILGDFSGTLHTVLVRVNEVYNSTGSSGFHTIVIVSNVPELYASAGRCYFILCSRYNRRYSRKKQNSRWGIYDNRCHWSATLSRNTRYFVFYSLCCWRFLNIYRKKVDDNANHEDYNRSFLTGDFLYIFVFFMCCVTSEITLLYFLLPSPSVF